MDEIKYLVDENGKIEAVQLTAKLWNQIEPLVKSNLEKINQSKTKLVQRQGPINDFKVLMQFWDFSYPYVPDVHCPHCGAETEDWLSDPEHKFILTNANIGGLLVFHCTKCGTTIRLKHFKDHIAYEHTVPNENNSTANQKQ